ncbi:MAG: type II secretion system protein GspJ [Thermodesulfobacteriota bacterium]|nr:type II secretion system protein GspJ [Thermodesulfobacteriota bacterium]
MKGRWNWLHIFQRGKSPSGFTLLELLISITIILVIITMIYSSFASSSNTIRICSERIEIYQTARMTLERMTEDISCAIVPKDRGLDDIQYGFIGEDRELDGMPADTLCFISTSLLKFTQGFIGSGLCEIGYSIETDSETDEYILYRRQDNTIDAEIDQGGIVNELAQQIRGIDLEYYDEKGTKWESWNFDDRGTLPSMVEITVSLEDENKKNIYFTTRVYLDMSRS